MTLLSCVDLKLTCFWINFTNVLNKTELTLYWLELNNEIIVLLKLLYSLICIMFDEVYVIDSIFLFITQNPLWNNLYHINRYINKGDLT